MIISKIAGSLAKPLLCICAISILATDFASGQSEAANISGTVYYSISPVADIPLTLWDPQTNISLTTFSDSNGHFYFANVAAGYHELWSDFPQGDPLNLTYWEPAVGYDIGSTDLSIDYYLWKKMRINDADAIQSGSQIIHTPYPTFCWSAPPEAAHYGIYIISNDAPTAIMESAYPISETCYTTQQALDFDRQYDTQVFSYDHYGNIIAFGSFLFYLRDGAGTTLTFNEFQPAPDSIIQQEVNPYKLLSEGDRTPAFDSPRPRNAGKNLNTLQSSLARLNLQPILHSVVLCSKGSDVNLDSIRVFINGRNVTREAGIYTWPANADCTSRWVVVINKYWIDQNVDFKVFAATADGTFGSGQWNFSVDTSWLWSTTNPTSKASILRKLIPVVSSLEALFLPAPVLSP